MGQGGQGKEGVGGGGRKRKCEMGQGGQGMEGVWIIKGLKNDTWNVDSNRLLMWCSYCFHYPVYGQISQDTNFCILHATVGRFLAEEPWCQGRSVRALWVWLCVEVERPKSEGALNRLLKPVLLLPQQQQLPASPSLIHLCARLSAHAKAYCGFVCVCVCEWEREKREWEEWVRVCVCARAPDSGCQYQWVPVRERESVWEEWVSEWVCVCVRERERERGVSVCVCQCACMHVCICVTTVISTCQYCSATSSLAV